MNTTINNNNNRHEKNNMNKQYQITPRQQSLFSLQVQGFFFSTGTTCNWTSQSLNKINMQNKHRMLNCTATTSARHSPLRNRCWFLCFSLFTFVLLICCLNVMLLLLLLFFLLFLCFIDLLFKGDVAVVFCNSVWLHFFLLICCLKVMFSWLLLLFFVM